MGYLAPSEMFANMLQSMGFRVYFERISNTSNSYFHIEINIQAKHMLGGSGSYSPRIFLKEWCNLGHLDVYFH